MEKAGAPDAPPGPSLQAVPFLKTAAETETVVLTPRQREKLMLIGTRLRLPARTIIYREGAAADSVFAIGEGAVKSYREFPSGKRSVCAFLFQRDLFGLAERGQYINSTQAITRATVYRLPVSQLMLLLKRDGDLQFQFLTKVTHELRESQRRAVLIHRREAVGRLAMFIELMAGRNGRVAARTQRVPLPMSRTDMAGYLGLSLESVSRAARELVRRKLVKFETPHLARIVDAAGLADVAAAG